MPVGNPVPLGNQFSLLASLDEAERRNSPKSKRKKIGLGEAFPSLVDASRGTHYNPKFITIQSTDPNKPLSSFSVFAKKKAIDGISKEVENINILRDGSLLVLTKNQKIAEKFINVKNFGGLCPVTIKYQNNLNNCKGTIRDSNLIQTKEAEILEELKSQGVVDIYKFKKIIDGKAIPTGLILLTFDLYKVPQRINVAWYSVKVYDYYPNPMRCKNCQLLGHTAKHCRSNASCDNCNLPPHSPENCTRSMCANCLGEHPASSRTCPKYLQQKEVLKIKTQNKCTMNEARKLYKQQNPFDLSTNLLSQSFKTSSKSIITQPSKQTTINSNNTSPINANTNNAQIENTTSPNSKSKNNITPVNSNTQNIKNTTNKNVKIDKTILNSTAENQSIPKINDYPPHETSHNNENLNSTFDLISTQSPNDLMSTQATNNTMLTQDDNILENDFLMES